MSIKAPCFQVGLPQSLAAVLAPQQGTAFPWVKETEEGQGCMGRKRAAQAQSQMEVQQADVRAWLRWGHAGCLFASPLIKAMHGRGRAQNVLQCIPSPIKLSCNENQSIKDVRGIT